MEIADHRFGHRLMGGNRSAVAVNRGGVVPSARRRLIHGAQQQGQRDDVAGFAISEKMGDAFAALLGHPMVLGEMMEVVLNHLFEHGQPLAGLLGGRDVHACGSVRRLRRSGHYAARSL